MKRANIASHVLLTLCCGLESFIWRTIIMKAGILSMSGNNFREKKPFKKEVKGE